MAAPTATRGHGAPRSATAKWGKKWGRVKPAEVYARTTPSPLNGADNPPPTQAGDCSLVGGDWELPASGPPGAQSTLFSFDAAGNFVMASPNSNLCDMSYPYGTYALSLGVFQIISNTGGCP